MAKPLRTDPASLDRMRANVASIDDPVAFARRYLHIRGLVGGRDEEVLLDVAVESIVKAGLVWEDRGDAGVSFTTWCYRYCDREVFRELRRDRRRVAELAGDAMAWHGDWLRYDSGESWYRRIDDRLLLHDLVERSDLSDRHRAVLEYGAHHLHLHGPQPEGHRADPVAGSSDWQTALRHLRRAARRHGYRDDEWTRARRRATTTT